MPVETRFYDTEGDGYWFKLEAVEKTEIETDAVVSLTHSEAAFTEIYLSADDVEKLVEELSKYIPAKAIQEIDPTFGISVPDQKQPRVNNFFYSDPLPG